MRRLSICLLMVAACKPDAGTPLTLVDAPRILALRAQPAEVAPGAAVTLDALVASPDGEVAPPSLDWSLCHSPRPLESNDVVSAACLSIAHVDYLAYAVPSVATTMPADACQLFGPDLPPSIAGQPDPRPVAADASGGWYQPYRADLGNALVVGLARVRCNLAGASVDVAQQFRMQYTFNLNPTPNPITLDGAPLDGAVLEPGASQTLTVDWPAEAAEGYPLFDVATQTLIPRRESLRVSWFATAGSFADERTGRASDDPALDTSNTFTAPTTPGTIYVWAVLRDDRGGIGWTAAQVMVFP
jgi:hypothetical protein